MATALNLGVQMPVIQILQYVLVVLFLHSLRTTLVKINW